MGGPSAFCYVNQIGVTGSCHFFVLRFLGLFCLKVKESMVVGFFLRISFRYRLILVGLGCLGLNYGLCHLFISTFLGVHGVFNRVLFLIFE